MDCHYVPRAASRIFPGDSRRGGVDIMMFD